VNQQHLRFEATSLTPTCVRNITDDCSALLHGHSSNLTETSPYVVAIRGVEYLYVLKTAVLIDSCFSCSACKHQNTIHGILVHHRTRCSETPHCEHAHLILSHVCANFHNMILSPTGHGLLFCSENQARDAMRRAYVSRRKVAPMTPLARDSRCQCTV
jgi:hypothetical protein